MSATDFYTIKPCKSTAAYETLPKRMMHLDLKRAVENLSAKGYALVADAGVLAIVRRDCEVTINPNGRLLIKTSSKETAERVAAEVYAAIMENGDCK